MIAVVQRVSAAKVVVDGSTVGEIGEGMLVLVACPECNTVMGRCDEVEELIRDVTNPVFRSDESICHSHTQCPVCAKAPYGQFRAATEAELNALGLLKSQYRRYHVASQ